MAVAKLFEEELRTFESRKDELVAQGEGKYVLIRGSDIAGIWTTYEDALQAGYQKFGLQGFFVRKIERIEGIHTFSRDISPRRT